jgi:hypothetical protein
VTGPLAAKLRSLDVASGSTRRLVAVIVTNQAAGGRARVWRGQAKLLDRPFALRSGLNVVRLALPPAVKRGRARAIFVIKSGGASVTLSRPITVPSRFAPPS